MPPKERPKVHGGPGMAVVAALSQAHAHAQRQPDRGPTQVENGEMTASTLSNPILIFMMQSLGGIGRAQGQARKGREGEERVQGGRGKIRVKGT